MKYRFAGKEKRLTFGLYPEVSLTEARDRRDAARRLLREHVDPGIERLKVRAAAAVSSAMTFEKVARAWHKAQEPRWSPIHRQKTMEAFDHLVPLPRQAVEVLDVVRRLTGKIELLFPASGRPTNQCR